MFDLTWKKGDVSEICDGKSGLHKIRKHNNKVAGDGS